MDSIGVDNSSRQYLSKQHPPRLWARLPGCARDRCGLAVQNASWRYSSLRSAQNDCLSPLPLERAYRGSRNDSSLKS